MNLGDLVQIYGNKNVNNLHQTGRNDSTSTPHNYDQNQNSQTVPNTQDSTSQNNNTTYLNQNLGYAIGSSSVSSFPVQQNVQQSFGATSPSYTYSYPTQQHPAVYTSPHYFFPSPTMYSFPFQQPFQSPASPPPPPPPPPPPSHAPESVGSPSSTISLPSYPLPAPNFSPRMPVPTFFQYPSQLGFPTQTKSKSKSKKKSKKSNGPSRVNPNSVIENVTYSCDSCERTFQNKIQYETHLSTHLKCPFSECTFSASYRVMKLHKLAHSFPNFGKKETPEEIAKYIEERRRRYPTKENIKKKEEEMRVSGEQNKKKRQRVFTSRYRRQIHSRGQYRGSRSTQSLRRTSSSLQHSHNKTDSLSVGPSELPSTNTTSLSSTPPIPCSSQSTSVPRSSSPSQSGDLSMHSTPSDMTSTTPHQISALSSNENTTTSLTSSATPKLPEEKRREEGELPVDTTTSTLKDESTRSHQGRSIFEGSLKRKRLCKFFVNGRCLKGEQCTFLHDPRLQKRPCHGGEKHIRSSAFPSKGKQSLFQKLLQSEMTREFYVILQCLKYIVQNNFFQELQHLPSTQTGNVSCDDQKCHSVEQELQSQSQSQSESQPQQPQQSQQQTIENTEHR